jgi:CotH kinase protein/Secretion system C-terminal sorting domain
MRNIFVLLIMMVGQTTMAQLSMFEQDTVNSIYLTIPPDSFAKLYALDGKYYQAQMVYTNGFVQDSIAIVAIRFRGNTSLISNKKSIKISFNHYIDSVRYKGLRKLNLIGNHNDPTMIREKLFYHCWQKMNLPKRRISFVNVYINQTFFGLYTNVEEIDKEWLKDVFAENDGNLYKCSYGADLSYAGATQQDYKNLYSGSTRTYDLQTNETADNYNDLLQLITTINNNSTANYLTYLDTILDYKLFLKALALDVATGNWDDYAFNKNNFILYHDSAENRFKLITIDADNTFGVDWSGIDWTKRDPFLWYNQAESRPLAKRLMNNAQAKALFKLYLDSAFTYVVNLDSLNNKIDEMQALIAPHAALDSFRTLDYGYTMTDFSNGFTATVDSHTPYGIKPFLQKRVQQYLSLGIEGLLGLSADVYPNPCASNIFIANPHAASLSMQIRFFTIDGRLVKTIQSNQKKSNIDVRDLQNGIYYLEIKTDDGKMKREKLIKQ